MPFSIRTGFKRNISVSFLTATGTPGQVEGIPTWELSDSILADLTPASDGMSAEIAHNGSVGDVTLTLRADGDLGVGVHPIVVSDVASMLAPLGAVAGSFTVGDETPIA